MTGIPLRPYKIAGYQEGYERDQARIGQAVAAEWIWPYAYNLDDLRRLHAQPDFDPDTRHYCFLGDEMVGYVLSIIHPEEGAPRARAPRAGARPSGLPEGRGPKTATLDFPRVVPPHGHMAGALIERALEALRDKGVGRVVGRVTTMCPGDIEWAERFGFTIRDWGYKVYYRYEMGWGKLGIASEAAREIDPESDLDACAELAARWYRRPVPWCRAHLLEWHEAGVIITHAGVRRAGKLLAACMAAPNPVRPTTAAMFYVYAPDEQSLRPLLARVIDKCADHGRTNLIADLVNEHRPYEPVYQALGFEKAAEWARIELSLD